MATKQIIKNDLLTKDTLIIIETDDIEKIEKQIQKLEVEKIDLRKYGRAYLIFLKKK